MTAPGITFQFVDIMDYSTTQGVEVNVPDQFEEIGFFLADDGAVAILEEVPGAIVSEIEVDGIAGKQTAHEQGKRSVVEAKEQMGVIGHECPGKTLGAGFTKEPGDAPDKTVPVGIIDEYDAAINAAYDDVLEKLGSIKAGGAGHDLKIIM